MKNLRVVFVVAMFTLFSVAAQAQNRAQVGQLLTGLLNVNIGAVQVDVEVDNVLNNFTLVNVEDVLNDSRINVLNNSINNNSILSDIQVQLTDVLQNFLNENQVVVGVLGGNQIVIQTLEEL